MSRLSTRCVWLAQFVVCLGDDMCEQTFAPFVVSLGEEVCQQTFDKMCEGPKSWYVSEMRGVSILSSLFARGSTRGVIWR